MILPLRTLSIESRIMNHYCLTWIENWCYENGWSEPFVQARNEFWAFPPNGVMPLPIPVKALRLMKQEYGLTLSEKRWCLAAIVTTVTALAFAYVFQSPMPIVAAFAFCAAVAAGLETED